MDTDKAEFEDTASELVKWVLATIEGREYLATATRDAGGTILSVTISKLFNKPAPLDPRRIKNARDRRRTRPL
jgi:hypothetical protein